MYDRVAVDGFILAAMDGEIRLTVAVEIELSQSDAASDGLLVDRGGCLCSRPRDFAGQSQRYVQ
jgi:hypothetical protein